MVRMKQIVVRRRKLLQISADCKYYIGTNDKSVKEYINLQYSKYTTTVNIKNIGITSPTNNAFPESVISSTTVLKSDKNGSDLDITGKIVKKSKKEYDDLNNENDYLKKELRDARSEIITYRKIISEDINANISNQAVNDEPVLTTHDKGKNEVQQSKEVGRLLLKR